jgi:membrane associated rhomboid family serine protease/Tfp pilus assembly protein PilF
MMDERPIEPESPEAQPEAAPGLTVDQLLRHITPRVWVTPALVALCLAGFVFELSRGVSFDKPTGAQLLAVGGEFGPSFVAGEWWRALTHMFLHAGPLHLAFNMWAFYSVGPLTERIFGNKAFLGIYVLSGIGGTLTSLAWSPMSVGVGASGAIFGVYGALLAFVLLHRGVFPVEYLAQQRNSIVGFIGYNVVFGLSQKNTDMAAHVGGLVTGALAGAALGRDVLNPAAHLGRRLSGVAGVTALLLFAGYAVRGRLLAVPEIEADRNWNAAIAHLEAKEYPQAIDGFSRAIVHKRTRAALFNRGLAYYDNRQLELAQDDFRAANELEADRATHAMLCDVGVLLSGTEKDLEPVIAHCTSAIGLESDPARRADLLAKRALAHGMSGQAAEVLADANAALELDANVPHARSRRAHAFLDLGRLAEAEQDCAAVLAASAPNAWDLAVCAQVAHKQKDRALERTRLEGALALDPTHRGALFAHAWLNEQEGRLTEAVTDYTALLAAEPTSTTALNNRAWVKVELGDFEGARADADRAVASGEAQGERSALHYGTQCFALAGLGERAAAKAACSKALAIKPDNLFDRGMVAFLEGRSADARRDWQKLSDGDPVNARELKAWLAKLPAR